MLRNSLILFGMLVIWVVVTIWYQFFRALRYPAIVEVLSRFFPDWIAIHDRLIFYSFSAIPLGLLYGLLVHKSHSSVSLGAFAGMIFLWTLFLEWQIGRSPASLLTLLLHGLFATLPGYAFAFVALRMLQSSQSRTCLHL